jgi:hypothetical protein
MAGGDLSYRLIHHDRESKMNGAILLQDINLHPILAACVL